MNIDSLRKFKVIRSLALLLILLCNTSLQAQFYSKRSVLFGGTSNGFISSIQVVNDTIYTMCAVTDTTPPYRAIGTFNIYGNDGNLVSRQKVDIPNERYIGTIRNCLIHTGDNALLYGGDCYSDTDNSIMLIKFDKSGNRLWYKTYSDSGRYITLYLNAVTQDSFFHYYFVGSATQKVSYDNDIIFGKFDSSGNLVFLKVFIDFSLNDAGIGITMNGTNNIIITGECGNVSNPSGTYRKFYELDTSGNILRYSLGIDTFGPSALALMPTYDGGYIMAGTQMCGGAYIGGDFNGSISRFDSNFNMIWSHALGPCGGQNTQFLALKLLPDSNYLAIGKWYDPDDTVHYDQYGWLVKFTQNGTILWEKKYRGIYNPLRNGDQSQLLSIGLFTDSTIIAAGQAIDRSATRNSQQGWLLHLDADGCLPDSNSCGILSGVKEVSSSPEWAMHLYPDPASDRFTLDYQLPAGADAAVHLIVTDALGREVYKESIPDATGSILVPTSSWSNGLYYCTIFNEAGLHLSKPVSVMH